MKPFLNSAVRSSVLLAAFMISAPVFATSVPFSSLDPAYTQEYYTGDISGLGWGPGYAWDTQGNLLLRGNGQIWQYSATADTTYNGNNVHSYVVHNIANDGVGYGMTNGLDGYIYAISNLGLERIDMNTWSATSIVNTASGLYGIDTMADGRIAYSDTNSIYAYDPTTNTNSLLFTSGSFVDGIAATNTGEIFLAVLGSNLIDVLSSTGVLINQFAVSHGPDGMAFGGGNAYVNNTDGTITRLGFAGPGYTGAVTETTIASGGVYGDLASAGPDCNFYLSQWGQGSGTDQVIRLSKSDGSCGFNGGGNTSVPEPSPLPLFAAGLFLLNIGRRFRLKLAK